MEKTLVLVKPDGVQRGLIGTVIGRIENKGLKIAGLKLIHVSEELAKEHYGEHVDRPFFGDLVSFITSSPVVALAIEGDNAVAVMRTLMGGTNPQEAAPGTIRGDFGMTIGMNLVHGSDSPESAERELNLFFQKEEVLDYKREIDSWIIE
ncbi:MAG: nucleoside-diphosphate kinase [SAR202 cluster bacterium]|nr:nucleoside-diphosphate kinase [SAR202 cluster bacterium]MEC7884166.1 nucleoside-diphosphate kinase [Chloroflexota bacterium]MQG75324.1 nucleoside-diphosphate kinase [SAR202 cluster bacterium]